ncbi:NAD(P)/FAD-dependent oxidoreductase [Dorea sp. D27]|uniref:NAD(P)/FAD-dependent oxidoreductase n=1 Tax=Dorea sp. D27 TaxID=658665 RepID=UPI0006738B67|nr:FAD-dependent oxidoreductase [Dorea sp. D27]KMZ55008.1 NAD(FAD)-utilizing dehydrogenase [Dorea sp. D27]
MIRITQLKLSAAHTKEELKEKILKLLRIDRHALLSYTIRKQSLDARKKPDIYYVYTVDVHVSDERSVKKRIKNKQISFCGPDPEYVLKTEGERPLKHRPVIIGTGPAGLFCGYELALHGYRPILLERGADVDRRLEDVRQFWEGGRLDLQSNVQFGEGGAGTFSDGKLNTLVRDPQLRNARVLKVFAEHGAPGEILYQSKPHLGTDMLSGIVKNMRRTIEKMGGEVRFHSLVRDIRTAGEGKGRRLAQLVIEDTVTGEQYRLETEAAVFAIGHSARDTFEMLEKRGLPMEAKSFAIGVRIEHAQSMVDEVQYGKDYQGKLPPASYKLTASALDGRGVYTFCMCPGGYVVNASSEEGRLAVNGMSCHDRGGQNANSAVIVTVSPEDYGGSGPLAGVEFQRRLEEAAFRAGGGKVPVQLLKDYREDRPSAGEGKVAPQIKGACRWTNVRSIFPTFLARDIEEGILAFERKLPGYSGDDSVVSAVESRTSSPVRLVRGADMQSSIRGIYPCGEGAGYAGGITSAAMDGMKAAEAIAKLYRPFDKHDEALRNF